MTLRRIVAPGVVAKGIAAPIICILALAGALLAFQKPFRQYISMEPYDNIPLPPDWQEKTEWVFARLMYPQNPEARFGGGRFRRWGEVLDWHAGGTSWTQDYPRADRHFAQALRRLTRVNVRSVEQPVNPDETDDFFNWPWLNAGEMGDWKLTEAQARTISRTISNRAKCGGSARVTQGSYRSRRKGLTPIYTDMVPPAKP